jgi:hypothetical protein
VQRIEQEWVCLTAYHYLYDYFYVFTAVTLEQVRFLQELNLPAEKEQVQPILDVLRMGTRLDNANK